jgi:NagD protein
VSQRREIRSWLMDMDGVLVREQDPIPGAAEFLSRLQELGTPFLVLTNNSMYTPRDLAARLRRTGLTVPEESIWTSALATARFLEDQRPGGSAFVVGEVGLTTALHASGYTLTDSDPDYVVLGETRTYSFERITSAIPRAKPSWAVEARGTGSQYIWAEAVPVKETATTAISRVRKTMG